MSPRVTPEELQKLCDDVMARYIKGDPRGATTVDPNQSLPPLTGIRRRRPALVSLESGDLLEVEPALPNGPERLPADTNIDPTISSPIPDRLLLDICALEDYVVRPRLDGDGVEVVFLWVTEYPGISASPGGDIPAVDFSDDLGAFQLPVSAPVVTPCEGGEPNQVVQECMLILDGRLGDENTLAVSSRLIRCRYVDLVTTRQAVIGGMI